MSRPVEHRREPLLEFLGDQDGPFERELKGRLSKLFAHGVGVRTAYLARVHLPSSGGTTVLLGLVGRESRGVVEAASKVFAALAGGETYLDIAYLGEDQARAAAKVCTPFFEATGSSESGANA